MSSSNTLLNHSYLYCPDSDQVWSNRTYFTWFSQFRPYLGGQVRGSGEAKNTASWLVPVAESGVLMLLFILSTLTNGAVFYTLCR
jgi:hypothetical protein